MTTINKKEITRELLEIGSIYSDIESYKEYTSFFKFEGFDKNGYQMFSEIFNCEFYKKDKKTGFYYFHIDQTWYKVENYTEPTF